MSVVGNDYDYYHKTCIPIGIAYKKQTNII